MRMRFIPFPAQYLTRYWSLLLRLSSSFPLNFMDFSVSTIMASLGVDPSYIMKSNYKNPLNFRV